MQVPNLIRQIPDHLSKALIYAIKKGAGINERVNRYWETKRTEFVQTNFWQQDIKPLYKRYIEPLNTTDYLLLTGSLGSGLLLTAITVNIYSIDILPIAMLFGLLPFAGACHFSFYRVRKHFDDIAYKHIDQIREIAHRITPENQNFRAIATARAALNQSEFSHLKDDLKELDKEIAHFRKVIKAPERDDPKLIIDTKQAFKIYLDGFQSKLAPHQPIKKLDGPEEGESKDDEKRK